MSEKSSHILKTMFIAITLVLACSDKQGDITTGTELKAGEAVNWFDLNNGLETAKKTGKSIFIFFYTDWCVYCKKMDNEVFSDPGVISYMNKNFISIRINAETDKSTVMIMGRLTTVPELMNASRINGYPGLVFWDKKQKPVTTIPGFIEKQVFLPVLKYIASECYLRMVPIDDFIAGTASCGKTAD